MTQAYPLQWPDGWPRTPEHKRQDSKYRFRRGSTWSGSFWTFSEARNALLEELDRLDARSAVLSTNYTLRNDGLPRADRRAPEDTGVAIYFVLNGRPQVMACDMHVRAEENMRSLTLSIEAMRALARHGGGLMMERAFSGFTALPPPDADFAEPAMRASKTWHEVLKVPSDANADTVEIAWRVLRKKLHPDAPSGSTAAFQELQAAYEQAKGSNR
ncbi:MAG: J domain-containing protein [Devosiaceae bacterium]|nr:J domain-containing protein [Devosiaceae bacterium MH13]